MFESFISLGNYCGVAASLSKLGLRSFSGPFDWYISSDFEGVLSCLENDFEDFLKKDNLEIGNNQVVFKDTKHGFALGHEVRTSFEQEYDFVLQKYTRRINRFRDQIKQNTCFIRAVFDEKELAYIQNNSQYIDSIIKKNNINNDIIYIVSHLINGSEDLSKPFFVVKTSYAAKNKIELRGLFDSNEELINYCINNFDEKIRYRNMVFDLQKENQEMEYRYDIMNKIDKIDLVQTNIPDKIIIYGAGRIGKYFYHKVKNKCEVCLFIDRSPKGAASFEEVSVFSFGRSIKGFEGIPIIVTPCYEYEEIKTSLINVYGEGLDIIPLTDYFINI